MASSAYKRVKCKVGSVEFFPIEAKYALSRAANQVGRRVGESLVGRAHIWVDPNDLARISQDNLVALWRLATEARDPLYRVEMTWYLEDGDRVLCSAEFQGWISVFQFTNPAMGVAPGLASTVSAIASVSDSALQYNNILYLELVVVLDEPSVSKHRFTK